TAYHARLIEQLLSTREVLLLVSRLSQTDQRRRILRIKPSDFVPQRLTLFILAFLRQRVGFMHEIAECRWPQHLDQIVRAVEYEQLTLRIVGNRCRRLHDT